MSLRVTAAACRGPRRRPQEVRDASVGRPVTNLGPRQAAASPRLPTLGGEG